MDLFFFIREVRYICFSKEENKYMFIPNESINNILFVILYWELPRYSRCSTQEFNFLKIKNKILRGLLRSRGYIKTFFWKTLQENKAYSPQSIERKFYSSRKENIILENAEQIVYETFSNVNNVVSNKAFFIVNLFQITQKTKNIET